MLRTAMFLVVLFALAAPPAIAAPTTQLAVPAEPLEDPSPTAVEDPYVPLGMDIFAPPADLGEEPLPLDPAED
jgi:hypothetical protein